MRLFIAVNFSQKTLDRLFDMVGKLRENAKRGTFSKRENLHLTLAFLGEVGFDRLDLVKQAMDEVAASSFELVISGVGRFKREDGDIVWAAVRECRELDSVYRQLRRGLEERGFRLDGGRFTPHITLGRRVVTEKDIREIFGRFEIREKAQKVSLILSEREEGGMRYTEIYGKELRRDEDEG